MAEGVGFEPTVGLLLLLISSQVPLTTQPPFHPLLILLRIYHFFRSRQICIFYTDVLYCLHEDEQNRANDRTGTKMANNARRESSPQREIGNILCQGAGGRQAHLEILKTDRMSVAQLRLGDFLKEERHKAESVTSNRSRGKDDL